MKKFNQSLLLLFVVFMIIACQQKQHNISQNKADIEYKLHKKNRTTADANLLKLANEHASMVLKTSPEWATQLGVTDEIAGDDFNGRLSSYTAQAQQDIIHLNQQMIATLKKIDRQQLSPSVQVTYDVLLNAYQMAYRYNQYGIGVPAVLGINSPYVINQLFGPHIDLPRLLITQQSVTNRKQIAHFLTRLESIPRVLDEIIMASENDANRGIVAPTFILDSTLKSIAHIIAPNWKEHPIRIAFIKQFEEINDLNANDRQGILAQLDTSIKSSFYPAYQKLQKHIQTLKLQSDDRAGMWKLATGEDAYQTTLDAYGASGMSADEIHQLGLRETERIHQQMDKILVSLGHKKGSVGQRLMSLASDTNMQYDNNDVTRKKILSELQKQIDDFMHIAPQWFKTIPKQPIEVRLIPAYEGGSAYYTPPSLDGQLPGIFWINLNDTADWPKYTLKTLTYHEAVPGHHFQASLQMDVKDMPLLRNMLFYSEFGEGWALYGEQLADEMGLYTDDPLGNLGRLRAELYRAARLVVDTGLHHKRWTREYAINWMMDVTGERRAPITREVDRYVVWPGQATSYKLGMIQIQRLRSKAEKLLGDQFDLPAFHDVLLLEGTMPLPILTQRINHWINLQQNK